MDLEFINRAQKITSFNLNAKDLQSLKYKEEIQYLFNTHFFPKFNIKKETIQGVNINKLNNAINILKSQDSSMFAELHKYNIKGIGPGEATLFFLIKNAYLGGGSSAGVDLIAGSEKYEVKAVNITSDGFITNFKVGGTVPLSNIITFLNILREKFNLGGSKTEISGSILASRKEKAPKDFAKIQTAYADVTYNNYFKNHEIIFINNATGPKLGNIEAIKQVNKADIFIERVTNGTVKPKLKL
jgi:hypothetical protein